MDLQCIIDSALTELIEQSQGTLGDNGSLIKIVCFDVFILVFISDVQKEGPMLSTLWLQITTTFSVQ